MCESYSGPAKSGPIKRSRLYLPRVNSINIFFGNLRLMRRPRHNSNKNMYPVVPTTVVFQMLLFEKENYNLTKPIINSSIDIKKEKWCTTVIAVFFHTFELIDSFHYVDFKFESKYA